MPLDFIIIKSEFNVITSFPYLSINRLGTSRPEWLERLMLSTFHTISAAVRRRSIISIITKNIHPTCSCPLSREETSRAMIKGVFPGCRESPFRDYRPSGMDEKEEIKGGTDETNQRKSLCGDRHFCLQPRPCDHQ